MVTALADKGLPSPLASAFQAQVVVQFEWFLFLSLWERLGEGLVPLCVSLYSPHGTA